jgi:hypothetical protein
MERDKDARLRNPQWVVVRELDATMVTIMTRENRTTATREGGEVLGTTHEGNDDENQRKAQDGAGSTRT